MGREELLRKIQETRQEIEPGQDVSIGLFRPEDAPGIAQAYYETYGPSFPLEHVYDPAEIVRRNATDAQHTLVARTSRGEVVGLIGLFRRAPNPEVYEIGQLMVLRNYRMGNLATGLNAKALNELPQRLQIPVVFGEAVSSHTVSQRLGRACGSVFTGLEVECMPSGAPAREGGTQRNISLFLTCKVFRTSSCPVHLPEAYRAFCESIYAELHLPRELLPPAPLEGVTVEEREVIPACGLARLSVRRCGADFADAVATAEASGQNAVQVILSLGDPAAPSAVDLLRGRGYFLAGLLPCWFGPDALVLQKLRQEPDWEAIQVGGPEAESMRAVVRRDWERARRG